jgi:hypothetical protein
MSYGRQALIDERTMVTKRTGKTRIADVERYRIAQRFHELALAGREAFVAASQLARRHGVSTDEVLLSRTSSRPSRSGGSKDGLKHTLAR